MPRFSVDPSGLIEAVWLDESVFRAGPQGVDEAVAALKKIQAHAGELAEAAGKLKRE
ncbi:MAG TPA: hypothetical protein VLA49_07450 [Anaerolineales bacterium]|nr:hypothetical protein [Anaerolineales bacterium]